MIAAHRKRLAFIFLLTLLASLNVSHAQQRPVNGPNPNIEVTASLVEIYAVVTDSHGRPMTNLTAGDFKILQDGQPKTITTFSVVSTTAPSGLNDGTARGLTREEVKRTIAFVVDDVRLDWGIGYSTFDSLRRILPDVFHQTIRVGDLVGLFSLSRHQGFEQFTTNQELLKTLASELKFRPTGMQEWDSTGDVFADSDYSGGPGGGGPGGIDDNDPDSPVLFARAARADSMEELSIRGLTSIIEEMKGMPGRKSIVFLSTGIKNPHNLSRLIEQAQRAGIAFYPVDPRKQRNDPTLPSSLVTLAKETGGIGWGREEELDKRLSGALQDQDAYYVLGYRPDEGSFDRRQHKIEIKVTNKDLLVRSSRPQFSGIPDTELSSNKSNDVLSALLSSPYRNSSVRTTLTTFFTAESGKSTLNSAVFVDGRDLRTEQTANGKFRGAVELRAAAIDPKGNPSGEVGRIARFELDDTTWRRIQETGMVFKLPQTGEKPGPYQIRVALRDVISGATGTASAFLEIPDVKKGKLTLSDVLLSAPANVPNPHPLSNIAARSFARGSDMEWTVEVYNARPGDKKSGGTPRVQTSVRVFRGTDLVYETPFAPAALSKVEGRGDFAIRGLLHTGDLPASEYVLRVMVRDENAKNIQVSRSTDFRILP